MFFVFSKILLFLIQPLNWIIAFLLVGYMRRKHKSGKRRLVAGIAMAVFFTNPLAINLATRAWEPEPVPIGPIKIPYDVGIVLGGFSRVIENFPDRIHLSSNPNRFIHAIQLYHAGIEVSEFVTDQTEDPIDYPTPGALILPKANALSQWDNLIKEWVGYAAYKFQGYL